MILWILVAHRAGAVLFKYIRSTKQTTWVESFPFPQGRLKNRNIDSDRPGRVFGNTAFFHHGLSTHQNSIDHLCEKFAKMLSIVLKGGRNEQKYDRFILIADPKMMGWMLKHLDSVTQRLLLSKLEKNIPSVRAEELAEYVKNILRENAADLIDVA